ncbi:SDR family NAD(P)-dependent oxidoreductase [Sporichthya polymorpha]|uniref:SDR family NAD(P)-dependent oxidoreductase n=1 Tax=Sporichthya polymorpha TaxID=35751 RepID=UPI00048BAB1E|nr:SDR family oxidoreductase [Sporichthya polymorpha]
MSSLAGLTAVVTGGNGGLGLGLAVGIAKAGGNVAIWARNAERNIAAVEEISRHGGRAIAVACDVSDEADIEAAMKQTVSELGPLGCFVANAGIHAATPLVDTSLDEWRRVVAVNLDGGFLCTREAARQFVSQGQGGAIIVVSSTIVRYGAAGNAAYAASKCGLAGLGRTLAVELARHRVRCNILIPGWTRTGMNIDLQANDAFLKATTSRTPVRRWANPEEFHEVAAFLADPKLTFHTGNEVFVDGGYTIF